MGEENSSTSVDRQASPAQASALTRNNCSEAERPASQVSPAQASALSRNSCSALLALLWSRYQRQLSAHPLRTKAFTAATLAALSDAVGQLFGGAQSAGVRAQLSRTLKFAAFGFVWTGPALHLWQRHLEARFATAATSRHTFLRKVLYDQTVFGPLQNAAFLAFLTLSVERRGAKALLARLRQDGARVQLAGWRFWPLVAALNYHSVAPAFRPLVANCAGLLWSSFLVVSSAKRIKRA